MFFDKFRYVFTMAQLVLKTHPTFYSLDNTKELVVCKCEPFQKKHAWVYLASVMEIPSDRRRPDALIIADPPKFFNANCTLKCVNLLQSDIGRVQPSSIALTFAIFIVQFLTYNRRK